MDLRRRLNLVDFATLRAGDIAIAQTAREVLRNRELLHQKAYDRAGELIAKFCRPLTDFLGNLKHEQ